MIGVLTLAARPSVATPYARVNVPPRSRPARALGPIGGFWDGGQESGAIAGRASGECGGRRGQAQALRGGGPVAVRGPGAQFRVVHAGSGGDGPMAVLMRGSGSGDGVHGGVLDPGVRGARPGRFRGAPGEPAGDQAGERAQERRAGLPVDSATHELWTVAGRVPGAGRAVPDALLRAPARPTHTRPQPRGTAHAKGAGADECAVGQCAERHHGQDPN